ncbi:MAG TPA: antibiotic biosynthesis monooxygenase [Egibacteraceae bacterium]|nr:antibiotic biosynthesis monooxygenase [Egibacteraceae bacterium]
MAYGLCGKILAVEGEGDTLERYLLEAAAALAEVDGCTLYAVSRLPGEPGAVWVIEIWSDREAHQDSLQLDAVQDVISRARPVIAGMGDRFELSPVGGKGLQLP